MHSQLLWTSLTQAQYSRLWQCARADDCFHFVARKKKEKTDVKRKTSSLRNKCTNMLLEQTNIYPFSWAMFAAVEWNITEPRCAWTIFWPERGALGLFLYRCKLMISKKEIEGNSQEIMCLMWLNVWFLLTFSCTSLKCLMPSQMTL